MKKHIIGAIISILIAEAVGLLSGLLAGDINTVYHALRLPPLSPAGWVFPVAWGILYALMGIAAYMVFSKGKTKALALYATQLLVNFFWTIIFFRFQAFAFGAVVAVILVLLVLWTTIRFWKASKVAGWLMLPYLAWLAFAAYLSIGVSLLN